MPRLKFGYIGSAKPNKRIANLLSKPIDTQLSRTTGRASCVLACRST